MTVALDELFSRLGRQPDFDAPELQAHDSADALILNTAAERLRGAAPGEVVVIGDRHGALTVGAAAVYGVRGIRTHQDPLLGERALALNAASELPGETVYEAHPLDASLLAGATTVLVQLPRGLAALEEIAWAIAEHAHPDVQVVAGGRVKHMTLAQNEVLGRHFGEVSAGLAQRKARVITAARPIRTAAPFPVWGSDPDLSFELAAFGATFGGATLDHGSRLLLSTFAGSASSEAAPRGVVDLGCGNGVLAVSAALRWPDAQVIASDQSSAAVRATRLTVERAGVAERIAIHRADGTEQVPDAWADLVLLNPPFHTGSTVHAGVAHRLIRDSKRALAPGGELRLVFNSHLAYRGLVGQAIGPVTQLARDRTFTVLSARTRA